ncbi:MAG: fructose-specific phosphotransferase system IIA component [Psychromonas sp.]|jgi:fructose-specific phosphotransferase system IIA component|uniref:fructose PTS transporter subunit IIA n=1 Tax=Psychromonas sp. TaxID=1884585 RepID=UPI0039E45276
MNITTLTNSSLINLQTTYADRDTAIKALAEQLDQQGKLHNKQEYLNAVFAREEHGATALGEGLAVPHGKSDAVKEASFAMATLKNTLQWQGIDEDEMEDVNLIFLLAIPNAEAGSTHMKILTDLTSALVDDDTREAMLKATSAAQVIALLNGEEVKQEVVETATKITALTNSALINLQTTFANRDSAIKALAEQLDQQGKLHNKEQYLEAVFEREAHGATALGEGLAVPHGKSDAVKEASFAVATLKETLQWQGIDDDEMEDVNLIFLLAIPNAEAGSTHMKILTDLTSALVDDDTREAVLKATTAEEIIALLDGEMPKIEAATEVKKPQTPAFEKTAPAKTPARADDDVSFITKILRSISKIFS